MKSDGEGYGSCFDADLNNHGVVDTADLVLYGVVHRSRQGNERYDPMMDYNNDLAINTMDLWIIKIWYFKGSLVLST
ncbi:hypothetical protein [Candidatus Thiodiazotropha sp. LNASS1]|uniref:hypothetical protein n=1 Tax=Candidatus Thiodiazotropha sp. LNASS1 TaxID=3096260 RepID=UPI0034DF3EA1